ncbi:K P-type ATPase (mediates high-affinity potassium or sodium uptake) [Fusarium mundagurra]|uniref:K P-type ATPase (Mediates high-affinity potassium or sodium uptake) n=1 Tax=Fusarium mundagurra TaxID=1567541 RepID=A0A8H5Z2X0_9HYPO|nr:K P-type ATPase (mediates high-affinity potassium or sodium uptake) [Fusarium mundagurra]
MESFSFERLPMELKIKIIRFAIPSTLARFVRNYFQVHLLYGLMHEDEKELGRIRASCPEIKAICDRIRYFVISDPIPGLSAEIPHEQRPESSQQAGLPIRRMLYWTTEPFMPIGAQVSLVPGNVRQTRGSLSQGGKWAGFRYWTETKKIELRPLSWPEVQDAMEDDQRDRSSHPEFIARLWINRPGEPIDAEQSQYGWIEVKAPEDGDARWVEQVATTWKMVRYMLMRMDEAINFDWHLENE